MYIFLFDEKFKQVRHSTLQIKGQNTMSESLLKD